jgi:hypothetical protein
VNATVIAAFPAVLDPDTSDLGPPVVAGPCDDVSAYVAYELSGGRSLFDVLGDPFVLERVDEYVSLLDHLARDPAVRGALASRSASHTYALYA